MDESALRAEILEILDDVEEWQLSPDLWPEVLSMIARIDQDWSAGELSQAARVLADLELAGPLRIGRIGEHSAVTSAPAGFWPVKIHLVHTLNGIPDAASTARSPDGPQDRPAS